MKAITIWQPWAQLILIGAKPYEFRGWKPPRALIGRRIAVHAGARPVRRKEVEDLIRRLESDDPALWSCLKREIALPFLRRVLAGLGSHAPSSLFEEQVEPFVCPLSCILCTAVLGQPKRGDECAREFGATIGGGNDSDRGEHFNWGWPLTDIEPVIPHQEVRGAQGFWDWYGAKAA